MPRKRMDGPSLEPTDDSVSRAEVVIVDLDIAPVEMLGKAPSVCSLRFGSAARFRMCRRTAPSCAVAIAAFLRKALCGLVLLQLEMEKRHARVIEYSGGVSPMRKPRKNYTPAEKVAILRRHLIDHVPISDICDKYQLPPSIFYAWQKHFFENGASAFERKSGSPEQSHLRTIAALHDKLQRKNEVVAELMEAHIQLKKELGEL